MHSDEKHCDTYRILALAASSTLVILNTTVSFSCTVSGRGWPRVWNTSVLPYNPQDSGLQQVIWAFSFQYHNVWWQQWLVLLYSSTYCVNIPVEYRAMCKVRPSADLSNAGTFHAEWTAVPCHWNSRQRRSKPSPSIGHDLQHQSARSKHSHVVTVVKEYTRHTRYPGKFLRLSIYHHCYSATK